MLDQRTADLGRIPQPKPLLQLSPEELVWPLPLLLPTAAKREIWRFTFFVPQLGQVTLRMSAALRMIFSKAVPHSVQAYSYIAIMILLG